MINDPVIRELDNRYIQLVEPYVYTSEVLNKYEFPSTIVIPAGFVCDYESVPRYIKTRWGWASKILNFLCAPFLALTFWLLSNTSKRGGLIHDYLFRINSIPVVPMHIGNLVYLEVMEIRKNKKWKRWSKFLAVELCGKGSYHKLMVEATYKEIIGDTGEANGGRS